MRERQCVVRSDVSLTVIVPTRNEAGNIAPLVFRLDSALGDLNAEILFVDDSTDRTPEEITTIASAVSRPVRLVHRAPAEQVGGLGGAVLAGLRDARGNWAVVMDGDLQHPPETVPQLVEVALETGADLVVASRYTGGGSADGLSSAGRARVSGAATQLAKVIFPRRLADCSDPMSGFFAVRMDSLDLSRLRPNGFKILLEILARSPRLRISECPFTFQDRVAGQSKASLREGLLLLRRLMALRSAAVFGRHADALARITGFAVAGATGILVNSAALWLFVGVLGVGLLVGAALATQVSTLWNFLLIDRFVYSGAKNRPAWARLLGFAAVNNVVLLARLPLLSWLVHSLGVGYLVANVVTLLAAFVIRFVLSDRYLFRSGAPMTMTPDRVQHTVVTPDAVPPEPRSPVELVVDVRESSAPAIRRGPATDLTFRYDIHGILTLGSTVRLKELDYFQTAGLEGPMDIEIRPGAVGSGAIRRRARVTQYVYPAAVMYEEHLGRHGADFRVDMGEQIQVIVGPMLVRSPHVLYTNVIEALLRFVLVSRGYMLLHSACLELNGRGVMLSARTDTGKTGTILRLLRENDAKFLSDDMTVLGPDGQAQCFPKPLTISQHTLRAVHAGDLSRREWRRLRVQSRLHSKGGRSIGARLGEMNVPIMSFNAVTQYVVPPPKYDVDRLVPCTHVASVRVEDLFIIERGPSALAEMSEDALLEELIDNTDDAYGFPPYRYFAPALVIGTDGYEELRARERQILASALIGVRARRLATPDFTWADQIPHLAAEHRDVTAATPAWSEEPSGSVGRDSDRLVRDQVEPTGVAE